jgi:hypothetical protein
VSGGRRLITESDVLGGRAGDPIVVDRDTILTPAASDAALRRGIRVEYRRDLVAVPTPLASPPGGRPPAEPAASPPTPACACSAAPPAAPAARREPPASDFVATLTGRRSRGFDAAVFGGSATEGTPRERVARAFASGADAKECRGAVEATLLVALDARGVGGISTALETHGAVVLDLTRIKSGGQDCVVVRVRAPAPGAAGLAEALRGFRVAVLPVSGTT